MTTMITTAIRSAVSTPRRIPLTGPIRGTDQQQVTRISATRPMNQVAAGDRFEVQVHGSGCRG